MNTFLCFAERRWDWLSWLKRRIVVPKTEGSNPSFHPIHLIGVSPSGKATDSDSVITEVRILIPLP